MIWVLDRTDISSFKLQIITMDKLVAITESVASQSSSEINEEKFVSFMRECPIWDYYRITQVAYLGQSHEEKMRLISDYYKKMLEGKIR